MKKFEQYEAVVFEPWSYRPDERHPLKYGELVYYLGEIPNVPGHCIVARYTGEVVPMIHPDDLREAREEEL